MGKTPAETDQTSLPCLNTHIPERGARYKLHGRATQPRESGSYRVGIARPQMDKGTTNSTNQRQEKSHAATNEQRNPPPVRP